MPVLAWRDCRASVVHNHSHFTLPRFLQKNIDYDYRRHPLLLLSTLHIIHSSHPVLINPSCTCICLHTPSRSIAFSSSFITIAKSHRLKTSRYWRSQTLLSNHIYQLANSSRFSPTDNPPSNCCCNVYYTPLRSAPDSPTPPAHFHSLALCMSHSILRIIASHNLCIFLLFFSVPSLLFRV